MTSKSSSGEKESINLIVFKEKFLQLCDYLVQFLSKFIFDQNYRQELKELVSLCFGDYGKAIILNLNEDLRRNQGQNNKIYLILILLITSLFLNLISYIEIIINIFFPFIGIFFITIGFSLLISSILSQGSQLSLTISPPLFYTSWSNQLGEEEKKSGKLIESGPYLFVRHPMYSGIILICLGKCFKVNKFYQIVILVPIIWLLVSENFEFLDRIDNFFFIFLFFLELYR